MDLKRSKAIIKALSAKGYDVSSITLGGYVAGVKVCTDYVGLYPSKAQFAILDDIRKTYGKMHTVEPRGYYSAIFIY